MRLRFLLLIFILAFPGVCDAKLPVKSWARLKSEGVARQTMDFSCGAASLAILLNEYFEDRRFKEAVLLKDIIFRLDAKEIESRIKEGFSMLDLKNLAIRLGYVANGIILPYDAIEKLKGPVIILLHQNGIKHFVILRGARNGRAYITDPIEGHVRIPSHQLVNRWKGEALIVGRPGWKLKNDHGLSIYRIGWYQMEGNTVRALQGVQPKVKIN